MRTHQPRILLKGSVSFSRSAFLTGSQEMLPPHSKGLGVALWGVWVVVLLSPASVSAITPYSLGNSRKISATKKSVKTVILGDPAF